MSKQATISHKDILCQMVLLEWIRDIPQLDAEDYAARLSHIHTIYDKLIEWGMAPVDLDSLDHATIAYSHLCQQRWCCDWSHPDTLPDWQDDLHQLLTQG